jgi:hypothetical protein
VVATRQAEYDLPHADGLDQRRSPITTLRDAQCYVHAAEMGSGHDMKPERYVGAPQ